MITTSPKLCSRCKENEAPEYHAWCQTCRKNARNKWAQDNPERVKSNRLQAAERCRAYVYEYLKSHPCSDCPEHDPVVLEFDHVRGIKKRAVMELVGSGSLKAVKAEIEKCDVVCANCHTRRTYELDDRGYRIRIVRLES